jgi:hypothetical protein
MRRPAAGSRYAIGAWDRVCFLCLALPFASSGCAPSHAPPARLLRPAAVYGLQVLHVGSEFGTAAGYPLTERLAVTSAHLLARRSPVAAVEGAPMLAGNLPARVELNRHELDPVEDWVLLAATEDRFRPNDIDPGFRPTPDQAVLLGGFPLVGRKYTRRQFWDIPPMVIEGKALDEHACSDPWKGLVLVEVPQAAYGGFSGGPAACIDDAGRIVVWGTIVAQGYYGGDGNPRRYVLGVAPLPDGLLPVAWWRSY